MGDMHITKLKDGFNIGITDQFDHTTRIYIEWVINTLVNDYGFEHVLLSLNSHNRKDMALLAHCGVGHLCQSKHALETMLKRAPGHSELVLGNVCRNCLELGLEKCK